MKQKKRVKYIDDGRVIASMNVEGMPWYSPKKPPQEAADGSDAGTGGSGVIPVKMTRRESFSFAFGVMKAALLVTFVFIGALFLFILFCTNVWLR